MKYKILKFHFNTAVHFGENVLSDSNSTFSSDTLFNALCVEKSKSEDSASFNELLNNIKNNNILFSDAFPYIENKYFLPKPIMNIESKNDESNSVNKKSYKKLNYLCIDDLENYINGQFNNPDGTNNLLNTLGKKNIFTRVCITDLNVKPYQVGTFSFNDYAGLYIIVLYNEDLIFEDFFNTIISVGISGIGGKKSSGLGKFDVYVVDENEDIYKQFISFIEKKSDRYMLLSSSLPREDEIENVIKDATFNITRKSGFVDVSHKNISKIKKKDLYVFKSGSCFKYKFEGDIYNVSFDENHKIFRYAKSLFIGV